MTPALLKASHPGPTVVVTGLGAALAAAAGRPPAVVGRVAAALLLGQLSIGWANDAIDAERDRAAARHDKPVVVGSLDRRLVAGLAGAALVATVPASLALGRRSGAAHLLAVAGGWAYDLGLKRTVASPVPFATSFGLLPTVAVASCGGPHPAAWLTGTTALLGVGAHLANTLPDLADDVAAGSRGLPQRLGPRATRAWAAATTGAAALGLALAPAPPPAVSGRVAAAATRFAGRGAVGTAVAGLVAAAVAGPWAERSRAPFALTTAATVLAAGAALNRGVRVTRA